MTGWPFRASRARWLPVAVFVMTALGSCGSTPQDARMAELYRRGNAFYEQGRFDDAIAAYEQIVQQGYQNGYVYYNLGNAYFKQQHPGKAILSYERARRLIPRDADVRANLDIANLRIVDNLRMPDPWFGVTWLLRMYNFVSADEAILTASGSFLLLGGIAVVLILSTSARVHRIASTLGIVMIVVFLIGGTVATLKTFEQTTRRNAIILAPTSDAHSGPGQEYDLLFSIHEGAKVTILERRGGWSRILLPDRKGGWVAQGDLEAI